MVDGELLDLDDVKALSRLHDWRQGVAWSPLFLASAFHLAHSGSRAPGNSS